MSNYKQYKFSPLTIYGMPTGGKGVLARLLDGMPEVNTSIPMLFHDSISSFLPLYRNYIEDKSTEVAKSMGDDKRSYFLRKLLIDYSAYYITFENAFISKNATFNLSTKDFIKTKIDIPNNFFQFDANLFYEFLNEDTLDENINFRIISANILEVINEIHLEDIIYCMSISTNRLQNVDTVLSAYPDGKIIYVDRFPLDAVGSSFIRESRCTYTPFMDVLKRMDTAETCIWVGNLFSFRNNIIELCKSYPEKIYMVGFEELLTDTRSTMHGICNFLNVEFNTIYTIPTFRKERIAGDDFFHIQDDVKNILSEQEYNELQGFIHKCLHNKTEDHAESVQELTKEETHKDNSNIFTKIITQLFKKQHSKSL